MKVLIGYDGSDSAREAIQALHRAGLPRGAEVLVVSATDVWPHLPTSVDEPDNAASAWQDAPIVRKARALAAQARAEAQALAAEGAAVVKKEFPDWTVSHAAYAGSPYVALTQAPEGTPDLLVVGSQGRSAWGRLFLGSVSQNALAHAACSVRRGNLGNRLVLGPRHGDHGTRRPKAPGSFS